MATPIETDPFPARGTVLRSAGPMDAQTLCHAVQGIAEFVQSHSDDSTGFAYDDWLQHDGLMFERGEIAWPDIWTRIDSVRTILASQSDDDEVRQGFRGASRRWYLRFRVCWSDDGMRLEGDFDFAVTTDMAEKAKSYLKSKAIDVVEEDVNSFRRLVRI